MLLFWILVVLLALAALLALAVPILLWWAFRAGSEAIEERPRAPNKIQDLLNPALWRAYLAWYRERPLQLQDHRKK